MEAKCGNFRSQILDGVVAAKYWTCAKTLKILRKFKGREKLKLLFSNPQARCSRIVSSFYATARCNISLAFFAAGALESSEFNETVFPQGILAIRNARPENVTVIEGTQPQMVLQTWLSCSFFSNGSTTELTMQLSGILSCWLH